MGDEFGWRRDRYAIMQHTHTCRLSGPSWWKMLHTMIDRVISLSLTHIEFLQVVY